MSITPFRVTPLSVTNSKRIGNDTSMFHILSIKSLKVPYTIQ